MSFNSTDLPANVLPQQQQQQQVKIPLEILIECKALKSKRKGLVGREWGWQCTADEQALKLKSDHTVWNCVGDKAEKAAIAKVQRDTRNHLPKDQYDIEFINSSLPRKSR
jgi:hypothetical protein